MSSLRARLLALLLVSLGMVGTAAPLAAHTLDIAHFRIEPEAAALSWRVAVVLPSLLDPQQPVSASPGCALQEMTRYSDSSGHRLEWQVTCMPDTAAPSLQTRWGRDGAIVEVQPLQGSAATSMLPGSRMGAQLLLADLAQEPPRPTVGQTALRYTWLGTTHVLIGWDHLAFVFCLAMLARGTALLWLISAFTLGHSVSLAASFLGVVRIPIAPVEAIIALSVVFMAREAWLQRVQDSMVQVRSHATLGITAAFGLIHGLGFASVLGELGVSAGETVAALAFFNVGVELGQLLFVAAVLVLFAVLARLRLVTAALPAALCAAGGMGLFWTLQRVIA